MENFTIKTEFEEGIIDTSAKLVDLVADMLCIPIEDALHMGVYPWMTSEQEDIVYACHHVEGVEDYTIEQEAEDLEISIHQLVDIIADMKAKMG